MDQTYFPTHILLKIFKFLSFYYNFNNLIDNYSLTNEKSIPIENSVLRVCHSWNELYYQNFCKDNYYLVFLFRMGVSPLYKKSFRTPNLVLEYLNLRDAIDRKYHSMPSKYPMDFYFIVRIKKKSNPTDTSIPYDEKKDFQNELILFVNNITLEYEFDLINDIRKLEQNHPKKKTFYFKGQNYYYLDLV